MGSGRRPTGTVVYPSFKSRHVSYAEGKFETAINLKRLDSIRTSSRRNWGYPRRSCGFGVFTAARTPRFDPSFQLTILGMTKVNIDL
jgi:hypothetical protein